MLKNITPQQIAFISAISIAGVVMLILMLLIGLSFLQLNFSQPLVIGAVVFIPSYLIVYYLLQIYIYRKIKLIYKSIHTRKTDTAQRINQLDFSTDIIEDVEKEVEEWSKNRENEIEQLKLLEEYRRNFLGDISHELKTPLFNIQGYIHTLLDGAVYDEKINMEYLRRAARNTERLHLIIEDLEVISRLESGENPLEITSFSIRDLALEVFEETEMMGKKNNIQIGFKDRLTGTYQVKADKNTIRQVLTNLIVNSIKYGTENGYTKVAFYNMDENLLVEVSDNGIGIEQNHLPHIFDRFYRVEKSRNRSQGGSGLGLSIVKHIIEAHRQSINVRSTPGVGSTFGFTLEKA